MRSKKLFVGGLVWILACALTAPSNAMALGGARRDPLTEKEADLVREAQALDKRTEVFAKAAERRLLALTDPSAATSKQAQKDAEKWGDFPTGTRAELLGDIASILEEAVTNIEDVGSHNSKSHLIPKSLRILAQASTRFLPPLTAMRDQLKDEQERDALEKALEGVQEIITAANKLPPEEPQPEKRKKDKG
jgi:acyl-CoA reductase-like NAD-dependent aldehyde dehydrogenase